MREQRPGGIAIARVSSRTAESAEVESLDNIEFPPSSMIYAVLCRIARSCTLSAFDSNAVCRTNALLVHCEADFPGRVG